jgi:hypothetical protein
MTLGSCGASTDCLFIADIGDNRRSRTNLEIVVVEETADFPSEVQPRHRIRIQYPESPRDAESFSIHPSGDLYILTKEPVRQQIFRLKRDQWSSSQNAVEILQLVATIDMARMLPVSTVIDRATTSMDISPDGKRVLILTYRNALELFIDLGGSFPDPADWKEGEHYRPVMLEVLEQQEAIAYLPDGSGFIYDTERSIPSRAARIMRASCRK